MLAIAILAAGKGTRMKSALPKVLQPLAGKTLIDRVLDSCNHLVPDRKIIILGHEAEQVKNSLKTHEGLEIILQQPQNGTGHAVQQLIQPLSQFEGELLILNGDVPLLMPDTIKKLINKHLLSNSEVTLLTTKLKDPKGYGRVFIDQEDKIRKIVEEKDCSEEEINNNLINAGVYCFNWQKLKDILPKIKNENSQKELYITDTISLLNSANHLEIDNYKEVSGINDRLQLSECEDYLQDRLRKHWMKEGVTFKDPSSCTISEECSFGRDVVIEPQSHIKGKCKIGDGCIIGPGSLLTDVILEKEVKVVYSVVTGAEISSNVEVGPFSHIRPKTNIANNCKIGNFVEIKKSNINESCKINHLSYIGDSYISKEVNIGAGTITANYDGKEKHKTIIGERSKTGANSVLVAPINIGSNVTIGAGSTITKDVPEGSLAISRSKQFTKPNWLK